MTEYLYGQPKNVNFSGVIIDIDRLKSSAESKINCWNDWFDFNRASGSMTPLYEHQVPEQLFSTDTKKADGVSAVKALAIAQAEGQRTYTFTSANYVRFSCRSIYRNCFRFNSGGNFLYLHWLSFIYTTGDDFWLKAAIALIGYANTAAGLIYFISSQIDTYSSTQALFMKDNSLLSFRKYNYV